MIFKSRNFIIGLLFVIFLLINLTSIYALDNSTVIDSNESFLSLNVEDNISTTYSINGGKFEDIQNTVNKAKNGDVINLKGNFIAKDNSSIISINKKLTIVSDSGAVLDGKNISGIFYLRQKSSGSIIQGLTFINGYRTIGSAMFINAQNITIDSCIFKNNSAYAYGGGGAVCTSYDLEKSSNLIVKNSEFISNKAPVSSGGLAAYGYNSKVINCLFEDNIALKYLNYTTYEAALQIGINNQESRGYVSNCTFNNNNAEYDEKISSRGGATALRKGIIIENTIFNDNKAKNAGAISIYESGLIKNCNFIENNALNGGAISTDDNVNVYLKIIDSIFQSNKADCNGVINFNGESLEIINSFFISNKADNDNGLMNINSSDFILNNSLILNNQANNGLISINSNSKIINTNFINNTLSENGCLISNKELITDNVTFINNNAYSGAAITLNNGKIINSKFINNSASNYGGAIFSTNDIIIIDSNFLNNAAEYGGVIFFKNNVKITGSYFENNTSLHDGGVIFGDNLISNDNLFINNNALTDGGAIKLQNAHLFNNTFINNQAKNGGAIYTNNINSSHDKFISNYAENGGSLSVSSNIQVENTIFTDNVAENNGGSIIVNGIGEIKNSIFNNNIANYGGAVNIGNSTTNIIGCDFYNNSAINGSAIYNNGILNIFSTNFTDNLADSFEITAKNITVKKGEDIIIEVMLKVGDNILNSIYNNNSVIIDNETPKESEYAINQEVYLQLNNETYSEYTNEDGIAIFIINSDDLEEGNYTYYVYHPKTKLYTLIINNSTIEIKPNPKNNDKNNPKKKTVLKASKNNNKKYSSKTTSKVNVKNQKTHGSYVTNRKLKRNPYTIENQINFAKYVYKTTKYTIDDIGKTTNWDPIKVANYKLHLIKGYDAFSKKNPEVAEVIDTLIGLDKNGDMKIKDVVLNALILVPGGVILTGIKRVRIGIKITNNLKLFSRVSTLGIIKNNYFKVIAESLPKIASFPSKPIGTISSIVLEKITPKIYNKIGISYSNSFASRILNNRYRDVESVISISNWKAYSKPINKKPSKAKNIKKSSKNLKKNIVRKFKSKLKNSFFNGVNSGVNSVVGFTSKTWNKAIKNPSLKNKYRIKYRNKIYSSIKNIGSKIVSSIKRKYNQVKSKSKRKTKSKGKSKSKGKAKNKRKSRNRRRVKAKSKIKKTFKSHVKRSYRKSKNKQNKSFSRNRGRRRIRTTFRNRYVSKARSKIGNFFKKLKLW